MAPESKSAIYNCLCLYDMFALSATKLSLEMFTRDRSTTVREKELFRSVKVLAVATLSFRRRLIFLVLL